MTADLPEIGVLTSKLGEALLQLAEAKTYANEQRLAADTAAAAYRTLLDLVVELQKQINDAITICLHRN